MLSHHRVAPLRLVRPASSSPISRCSAFVRHVSGRAPSASLSRNTLKVPRMWKRTLLVAGVVGTSFLAYTSTHRPVRADSEDNEQVEAESSRPKGPLTSLIRTYVVYSLCSVPMLVDYSTSILSVLTAVPGIRQLTETFVRWTFFAQFVGAETAVGLMPILTQLRKEGKGALISYSVEVNAAEAAGKKTSHSESSPHKQLIAEYIRSVDAAADFEDQISGGVGKSGMGRRTWVPLKLTALLPDSETLRRFSVHLLKSRPLPPSKIHVPFPGSPRPSDFDLIDRDSFDPVNLPESCPLTIEDVIALRELKADLFRVCERARERGVRILIDAEHSWYQPAIDAFQLALMREFNHNQQPNLRQSSWSSFFSSKSDISQGQGEVSVQPLVYGTFQAYLRRTPAHLQQSLLDAQAGDFALGVKLVRGAYHLYEQTAHAQHVGQLSRSDRKVTSSPSIQPLGENEGAEYGVKPPVWDLKEETDRCYDECAGVLLGWIAEDMGRREERARVGAIFGTHNAESVRKILDSLVEKGLATSANGDQVDPVVNIPNATGERVTFGQLYGMRDALTEYIVSRTQSTYPCVVKCLPYGALSEVLPYLVRRAIENKSMLNQGSAAEERRRAGREIVRRARSAMGF